jgi:hypothetical protein
MITREEQEILAMFVLALPARNPWTIEHGEESAYKAHREALNDEPKGPAAAGPSTEEPLFEHLLKANPYWMEDRTRQILIEVMTDPAKVERLLRMEWFCRDLTGCLQDLVLADRPLLRMNELMDDRCILVLPVSPKAALFASSLPSLINDIRSRSDGDLVQMLNVDSAAQAKEHLFASGRHHAALAERYLMNDAPFLDLQEHASSDAPPSDP